MRSGKGHRDENFPVASALIRPAHRDTILAFYEFARHADDVADHPTASAECKLDVLEKMRSTLVGEGGDEPSAGALRERLLARGLGFQHPLDLLAAFRMDVTKLRYRDWDDLMGYCNLSAAPVGRFVLDVHGESHRTWPASDALCNALQVINHLQDCGADYRNLNRVYVPLDVLTMAGLDVDVLGGDWAPPVLRQVIAGLAGRTARLLEIARPLASQARDGRLALEIAAIHSLAESLTGVLRRRDPLSQRVHHRRLDFAALGLWAVARTAVARFGSGRRRRFASNGGGRWT